MSNQVIELLLSEFLYFDRSFGLQFASLLELEGRAALAARAFIRHRYTDYEDQLFSLELSAFDQDIDADIIEVGEYPEIKQAAHRAVDAFLDEHRKPD